jgi:spore coat protein U-like protein
MSMPMTRFLLTACCALLSAWALAAAPSGRAPGGGATCPAFPAECQINVTTFNFGRGEMSPSAPPIYSNATISVTCTRHPQDRLSVDVPFELKALPPDPSRYMRDQDLGYLRYYMYVDPARTRPWADGTNGTFTFQGVCFLDERNRACTIVFPLYGKVDGGQSALPGQWLGALVNRLEYQFQNCRP